uniref:Large ribosomal subunit protein uL24c n=1 Tax=Polysiphonia sertularioides TaxID=945028 RepID=A0A1Z1MGZ8_9FLOR|nr:ribosomal protein L24 [Polysiphonia sertularioides]
MKIKKGDTIEIISGKYKKNIGEVSSVLRNENKVTVKGFNIKVKHIKPQQKDEKGKIEKVEGPIHISNIKIKRD